MTEAALWTCFIEFLVNRDIPVFMGQLSGTSAKKFFMELTSILIQKYAHNDKMAQLFRFEGTGLHLSLYEHRAHHIWSNPEDQFKSAYYHASVLNIKIKEFIRDVVNRLRAELGLTPLPIFDILTSLMMNTTGAKFILSPNAPIEYKNKLVKIASSQGGKDGMFGRCMKWLRSNPGKSVDDFLRTLADSWRRVRLFL